MCFRQSSATQIILGIFSRVAYLLLSFLLRVKYWAACDRLKKARLMLIIAPISNQ